MNNLFNKEIDNLTNEITTLMTVTFSDPTELNPLSSLKWVVPKGTAYK